MKLLIWCAVLLLMSCATQKNLERTEKKWELRENIKTPESVYYDKNSGLVFVSNIVGEGTKKDGNGHISLLDETGKVLESRWVTGLNAPKGMGVFNKQLWVTDIDRVVVINLKNAKVVRTFKIKGAKFLNDIAISPSGLVFVSDTIGSKIYMISQRTVSTFMEGDSLESPNGLLFQNNRLYVASWGLTTDWSTKVSGRLYSIDMRTRNISYITKKPLGQLDGLEMKSDGSFLVSDWVAGKIFHIESSGKVSLVFKGEKGLADIGYIEKTDTILVPYMNNDLIFGL